MTDRPRSATSPTEADGGAPGHVRVDRSRDDDVVRLVLDRPPANVLDVAALRELDVALEELAENEELRLLVLSGAGRAFCAGVDVADHLPDRVETTLELFGWVVDRLLEFPAPVVAAVNGAALGGGLELALACDVVLARRGAAVGQPEIRLGVFPPAAAALLPRLVGRQRALDLILTGRTMDAAEARDAGLVQELLDEEGFEEEVETYVARMAGLSRPVLRLAKRAVTTWTGRPVGEAIREAERLYLDELMALEDPREGLAAFLEKREPRWRDG